jgi:hypothetical protein
MREVAPGNLVLSFEGTRIRAIGVARSYAYECPKPPEFGSAGPNWSLIGWKVDAASRSSRTRCDRRTTCRIFGISFQRSTRHFLRMAGLSKVCISPRSEGLDAGRRSCSSSKYLEGRPGDHRPVIPSSEDAPWGGFLVALLSTRHVSEPDVYPAREVPS